MRPRLVEEGKPINDQTDSSIQNRMRIDDDDNDKDSDEEYNLHLKFLEEEYEKAAFNDSSNAGQNADNEQHHKERLDSHSRDVETNTMKSSSFSSLQKASSSLSSMSASYKKGRKKLQTSFEIRHNPKAQNTSSSPSNRSDNTSTLMHNRPSAAPSDIPNAFTAGVHVSNTSIQAGAAPSAMDIDLDFDEDNRPQRYSLDNHIQLNKKNPTVTNTTTSQPKQKMQTYFQIGGGLKASSAQNKNATIPQENRMEIEDILPKAPLIVIDGANVAYAYAKAAQLKGCNSSLTRNALSSTKSTSGVEPDVKGIQISVSYFVNAGCRVQVVLPVHWIRRKPRLGDNYSDNARMMTPQVEILHEMESQNILCCSPPTDDDDAYAIAIARREDTRAKRRNRQEHYTLPHAALSSSSATFNTTTTALSLVNLGGAFVLSNDFFRDAISRDNSGDLKQWLEGKDYDGYNRPGRISYSFCDMGSMNEYGDSQLDFIPNPRHSLIEIIERDERLQTNLS